MNPGDESLRTPTVRESLLYERGEQWVICKLCERRCRISEGERGLCRARINLGGRLFTLTYGDISAIQSRPIEIKPFFHFHPGSTALTISTWSCNFPCPWCQNFHLSRRSPEPQAASFIAPADLVKRAVEGGDSGICVSFNEPTLLFEYCLDVFPLAKARGLYNCFVSNGYMTLEALGMLRDAGLDAIKIDVKGSDEVYKSYCAARSDVVWRNIREAKRLGMHVEVVNLIITGVNDDEASLKEMIQRCREIDPSMPLHFTRYFPAHQFSSPATHVEVLEESYLMARREGVKFPYLGNVPGHEYENTYCPSCGELLIERLSNKVIACYIRDGRCPRCGESMPIVGLDSASRL
jgi:pyruvate formate lyase activating enzyme